MLKDAITTPIEQKLDEVNKSVNDGFDRFHFVPDILMGKSLRVMVMDPIPVRDDAQHINNVKVVNNVNTVPVVNSMDVNVTNLDELQNLNVNSHVTNFHELDHLNVDATLNVDISQIDFKTHVTNVDDFAAQPYHCVVNNTTDFTTPVYRTEIINRVPVDVLNFPNESNVRVTNRPDVVANIRQFDGSIVPLTLPVFDTSFNNLSTRTHLMPTINMSVDELGTYRSTRCQSYGWDCVPYTHAVDSNLSTPVFRFDQNYLPLPVNVASSVELPVAVHADEPIPVMPNYKRVFIDNDGIMTMRPDGPMVTRYYPYLPGGVPIDQMYAEYVDGNNLHLLPVASDSAKRLEVTFKP